MLYDGSALDLMWQPAKCMDWHITCNALNNIKKPKENKTSKKLVVGECNDIIQQYKQAAMISDL